MSIRENITDKLAKQPLPLPTSPDDNLFVEVNKGQKSFIGEVIDSRLTNESGVTSGPQQGYEYFISYESNGQLKAEWIPLHNLTSLTDNRYDDPINKKQKSQKDHEMYNTNGILHNTNNAQQVNSDGKLVRRIDSRQHQGSKEAAAIEANQSLNSVKATSDYISALENSKKKTKKSKSKGDEKKLMQICQKTDSSLDPFKNRLQRMIHAIVFLAKKNSSDMTITVPKVEEELKKVFQVESLAPYLKKKLKIHDGKMSTLIHCKLNELMECKNDQITILYHDNSSISSAIRDIMRRPFTEEKAKKETKIEKKIIETNKHGETNSNILQRIVKKERTSDTLPHEVSHLNSTISQITSPEDDIIRRYINSELEPAASLRIKKEILKHFDQALCSIDLDALSPRISMELYGSFALGHTFQDFDIDITLITCDPAKDDPNTLLRVIYNTFRYQKTIKGFFMTLLQRPTVRYPLLIAQHNTTKLKIDVTINNLTGVYNCKLFQTYFRLDPRVDDLIKVVKVWSKRNGINNSQKGYYNSFTFNLLVIFYLQQVKLIPSLQKLAVSPVMKKIPHYRTNKVVDIVDCNVNFLSDENELKDIMKNKYSTNTSTLLELLKGFFEYYVVDYCKRPVWCKTISIREGTFLPTKEANQGYLFSIEDPLIIENDVGSKIIPGKHHQSREIVEKMVWANNCLQKGDLAQVFKTWLTGTVL
jgi:DNA polymerase sigma